MITTEDIGRPAENIEYYGRGVHALYMTDLMRWRLNMTWALPLFIQAGMTPYLLVPPGDPAWATMVDNLKSWFKLDLVADIPPPEAIRYFVAAPFHRGLRLQPYRVSLRPPSPAATRQ